MTSTHAWPRAWRGSWLTSAAPPDDGAEPPSPFLSTQGEPFGRSLYRGSFLLEAVPASVPLRITADSRYVLFVNGEEIGRGPVRSQPRRLRYDAYDIAGHLVAGTNRVVVLVTYYGTANAFWQVAPSNGGLGGRSALVVEADLGDRWFATDATWERRELDAWTQPPMHGLDGVPVERFDARRIEADWASGAAGDWLPAAVTAATNMGALGRSRPPTDPYGALLPRPIGELGGEVLRPVAARISAAASADAEVDNPVDHVLAVWPSVETDAAVDPLDVRLRAPGAARFAVAFDFGRVVAGGTLFELDAPEGTVLDVLYRETPATAADAFVMSIPRTGLRYVARGGGERFSAQEVNGFRYAHLLVTLPVGGGDVRLRELRVQERLGAWRDPGYFRSSDADLERLYAAGVRTVALNTLDAFTDCPTREQRAWVGDGVVHQLVHLTTNDDRRAAAWYVSLGTSPRPDGILPMSVVGEIESGQGATIPDWSLYWIHGVHNLLLHCGITDEVVAAAPVARRVLEWFLPYRTEQGVLADVPEWRLVDWSSILLSGESAIITALWARALLDYADISDALGNGGDAGWARGLHDETRAAFGRFWDEERGTVVDHVEGGERQAPASQLAGATAIVADLLDDDRIARTVRWIGDPDRQVVRSWIGGDGTYDQQKILEQMRGTQRIDWDADRETVIAQPFAAFVVHDAYAAAGRPDLIVASCRRWLDFLQGGLDSFGECWGWGTPAHGWSSTPTRDLVQHVLGVLPSKPGFAGARITPAYGVAEHVEGSHPTVHGPIRVSITGRRAEVSSPVPFVLVGPDGEEHRFEAGEGAAD
jgi:alpha-L-rhamnosidase